MIDLGNWLPLFVGSVIDPVTKIQHIIFNSTGYRYVRDINVSITIL